MGRNDAENRISWHQGFYGGMELELRPWKAILTFSKELELSKEPIVADMLVIKKMPDVTIDNPIARRFRTHNLLEYKSPEDTLSIDGFFKGLAYVYLYKSQGETENAVPITEMTYSAFCFRHPRKLFDELQSAGFQVSADADGIYAVTGHSGLDIQVIVLKELAQGTHLPLRVLLPNADSEDVKGFLAMGETLADQNDWENYRAALGISISANQELYNRIKEELHMDTETVLRNVFPEYFMKEHSSAKAEGKAEEQMNTITRMLRHSEPMEKIMAYTNATKDTISRIADSMGIKLAG